MDITEQIRGEIDRLQVNEGRDRDVRMRVLVGGEFDPDDPMYAGEVDDAGGEVEEGNAALYSDYEQVEAPATEVLAFLRGLRPGIDLEDLWDLLVDRFVG